MDNKYQELQEMAQRLVDNHLLTKDEKLDLTMSDYNNVLNIYEKLTLGLLTISKWDKKQFNHIYNKIN